MDTTTLTIKGMVCSRCIMALRSRIEENGILVKKIELGEVEVFNEPKFTDENLAEAVTNLGFEILQDKQTKLIQLVKALIDDILESNQFASVRFSEVIADRTHSNYDQVSSIFSSKEGITIEHYIINKKIEHVKSFLRDTDLSLTEISYRANYSSVHHLSKQFKSVTGTNPSAYKQQFIR